MNLEHRHLEWKSGWKDDYLREICAFANAQGGTLCIGLDDRGQVSGVSESTARKLLENLPNKVRDVTGVQVDVNLYTLDGTCWLDQARIPMLWVQEGALDRHGSKAINPLVARAFYRAGHVESWGRGIKHIADACRECGTSPQTYRFTDSEVVTVFELREEQIVEPPKFTERQLLLISWLKEHPASTRMEVSLGVGVSMATLKREFSELLKYGAVQRIGDRKAARWSVIGGNSQNRENLK